MKIWIYYLVQYLQFYFMHILSSTLFIISGVIAKLSLFVNTDPGNNYIQVLKKGVYILLFFLWGHVQIAISFCLATLFSKSRTALGNKATIDH